MKRKSRKLNKQKKDKLRREELAIAIISVFAIIAVLSFVIKPEVDITGAASSGTGTTRFEVIGVASIIITNNSINLGLLQINETKNSEDVNDFFNITNDGSVNMDVYVYGQGASETPFTSNLANTLPNEYYKVHVNSAESGTANTTYFPVPGPISQKELVISDLSYTDGSDKAAIGIQVTVPIDEAPGLKNVDLVIYAEAH